MKNALNSQSFRDLNEHRSIVDKDCLRSLHLGYVQSKSENIHVGFAYVYEARGYETVDQPIQFELLNSVGIEFAPFIADDDDLHSHTVFKLRNQIDHLWKRL
jgi:hypothetical protein